VNVFQGVVLGVVEGVTEFLPVSSTGHLKIVPKLLGWDDPGAAFSAIIQVGAIVAVLIYFRRDLWNFATAWVRGLTDAAERRTQDYRMAWYVIVATIPIGIAGLLFQHAIEGSLRSLWVIASALIAVGLVLMWAEHLATQERGEKDVRMRDIITIGFAQCLALIPGVSRSGATISTGLFLGIDRVTATRFSFLLSIPAITAAGLLETAKSIKDHSITDWTPTIVATIVSFFVAYASIAWLLRYVSKHSTMAFVVYRVAMGLLLLGLLSSHAISS
jgi:undecaprenyl-diphosphatase